MTSSPLTPPSVPAAGRVLFWVGTYTGDAGAAGIGIESIAHGADGEWLSRGLAVTADSPSFLAVHPKLPVVYAVHEFARTVSAYARDGETALTALGDSWPTGDAGCHVAVDPEGRFLVVACWGDGSVILFGLDAFGRIASRQEAPRARDPYARTDGDSRPSRAHASLMLGGDRLMTTDLGFDLVRVWRYEPEHGLVHDHEIVLPEGSGPRHLALHSSGRVYVDTEYSNEVAVLEPSADGRYRLAGVGPATYGGAQTGDAASEIALSADGRFAYVGVRGSNRIGTLAIGEDGAARPIADSPSGGDWPRHLAVGDGVLLVANQRSGGVAVLPIDAQTGIPGPVVEAVGIAAPTAVISA